MLVPAVSNRGESIDKEIMLRDNVIIARNEKQILVGKETYNLKGNKNLRNDLQQLQAVPVKPAVTLNQGISSILTF